VGRVVEWSGVKGGKREREREKERERERERGGGEGRRYDNLEHQTR